MASRAAPFGGVVGRTLEESTPWWPPLRRAPEGAPNILVVVLDDVGYAQLGCYGSTIATPTLDALAARGLRFSNFHTTALCSPTRAALLTGRNHHTAGMGRVADFASGFPGYDALVEKDCGFASEILREAGYATFALGKWHLAPTAETAPGAPRDRWPTGRGFDRFYGFLGGETDQYHPDLVHDGHQVGPPRTPEEGYHLTEDLVDHAIEYLSDLRAFRRDTPFFLWFASGACHSPHQAPEAHIDAYRGCFDQGWDAWRDGVYARQVASGLLPEGTSLSERPHWVPPWESLSADERRLYARMMEVYAGFLTHTDAELGRLLGFVETLGETENTLVVAMSDNGASAEGGPRGSFNEVFFFNLMPESLDENLARIDDLGTPRAHGHYPWGWAWAGNTPLKRWKRETHEGGVCDPLIVSWPARVAGDGAAHIAGDGAARHQYVHAIDLLPTLLELVGVEPPAELNGVAQQPIEGVSFAEMLADGAAPTLHVTQYYEMLGSRALYHDGWKAVVFHPVPGLAYDGSDPDLPFDEDKWELYHVAEDFSETVDLAGSMPDKLAEMVERWWTEAERYQVLPLNNRPGYWHDRRYARERYEFLPVMGALPTELAPNLRNRGFTLAAELEVPEGIAEGVAAEGVVIAEGSAAEGFAIAEGVVIAEGSASGGWAVYLQGGRLHYVYNFLGMELTTVSAEVTLPPGRTVARVVFRPTAPFSGDVDLYYDDLPVGQGHVPRTVLATFGMAGLSVGFQRGTAVSPAYEVPARLARGLLRRVVVEPDGAAFRHREGEERAGMAIQ